MRIDALHLTAFGHFTGKSIDLSHSAGSLVVVYGANEAGKSTSLRGFETLLFGFEPRGPDHHKHAKLQVGGVIVAQDGSRFDLVRRSGKEPLRLVDGSLFEEDKLRRLLRGVDRDLFRTLYGLDHERLRIGAKALLDRKSTVAESLFDAGIAGAGVAEELRRMRSRADGLFRAGARGTRRPPLNEAIRNFIEVDGLSKRHETKYEFLEQQKEGIENALATRLTLDDALRNLEKEKRRLEKLRRVAPLLARHKRLAHELSGLASVPRLTATARVERERLCADQAAANVRVDELNKSIARLELRLSELPSQESQRHNPATRERLAALFSVHAKQSRRRIALEANRDTAKLSLGQSDGSHPIEPATERAICALLQEKRALMLELRMCASGIAETEQRIASFGSNEAPVERIELERLEVMIARAERLLGTRAEAENLAAKANELAERSRVNALSLGLSPEQELKDTASAPAWEWVSERASREQLLVGEAQTLATDKRKMEREVRRIEAERQAVLSGGPILREQDLEQSRSIRDDLVRAGASLHAVERAIMEADSVADRMRYDVDRTTRLTQLELRLNEVRAELSTVAQTAATNEAERVALSEELRSALTPLGAPMISGASSVEWLRRRNDALLMSVEARSRRAEATEQLTMVEAHRCLLAAAAGDPSLGFEQALAELKQRVGHYRSQLERQSHRASQRQELETAHAAALQNLARLENRSNVVEESLHQALLPHGVSGDVSAEELVRINAARQHEVAVQQELRGLESEIKLIHEDERELAQLVNALRGAAEDAQVSMADVEMLIDRLDGEQRLHEQREDCLLRLAQTREERGQTARSMEEIGSALQGLVEAAGANSLDELVRIEESSFRVGFLVAEVERLRDQIALAGETDDIEQLEHESASLSGDDIEAELEAKDAERDELERRKERVIHDRRAYEEAIRHVESEDSKAAYYAEQASFQVAKVRALAADYVRHRLAALILEREIETYQKLHQGPVLSRAAQHFRTLTHNSFEGLKIVINTKNQPELVCMRSAQEVAVEALSDGAKDQLFLALRLATIEHHGEGFEALPLVLDDVLINFDEDRTRSALALLGSVASRMQVLLFTHLARTVELAKLVLGRGACIVEL